MNPSSPAVDIEGYLYKKEGVSGFKKWQRRWATLCDYCLYLYDNHGDRESRYAFLLPSVSVTRCAGDSEFRRLIKLEEPHGKIVLLAASNDVEFGEWYSALSAASRLKRIKSDDFPQDFRCPPSNHANNNSGEFEAMRSTSSRPVMRPDGYLVREEELMPRREESAMVYRSAPSSHRSGQEAPHRYREMSPDERLQPTRDQLHYAVPQRRPEAEDPSGGFIRSAQPVVRNPIHTVKEDPMMPDSDVLATRPLEEIKMKYPVSGLAKRMSIAASDLLGKSHDELLISLIQLNREKANLERVRNYLLLVLDQLHEDQAECSSMRSESEIQERIRRTIHELADVEHQIEISQPLISFIDNIVKMGAMYAGDDVMFATEYRKHLLSPQQYCPAKANIAFARKVQEQRVALSLSVRGPGTTSGSGIYDLLHEGGPGGGPVGESAGYQQTREALERELGELQTIYSTFLGKRNELSAYMKDLPVNGGLVPDAQPTSSTVHRRQRRKSGGDAPTEDNSIKFPRRSTSKQPRSDATNSLRRQQSLGANSEAARLSHTISVARSRQRDRSEQTATDFNRSRSLPLRKERPTAAETTIVTTARYVDNSAAAAVGRGPRASAPLPGIERSSRETEQRLEAERWRDSFQNGERFHPDVTVTASVAPRQQLAVPPPKPPRGSFVKSEDDGRPRSALQGQLDALLGLPQRLSSSSELGSRRHLDQLAPERPLVQLTPSRYAPGPSGATRLSLDRPNRFREARAEAVEAEMEAAPVRRLPGLFVDEDASDPTYERLSASMTRQERQRAPPNGAVSVPKRIPPRRRQSDDFEEEEFEMESIENYFDGETIDRALFTPGKVAIRERYDPNSESESDFLDDEERRQRSKRAEAIRRMLASHSLQEWTEAEVGSPPGDSHPVDRRQIEAEKVRREAILELRGSLALEVKEKSKAAARARDRNRAGETGCLQVVSDT